MGSGYGKDNRTLFYAGKTIGNRHSGFRVLKNGYAKDNRNVYFRGKLTTADSKTFRLSKTKGFGKDAYRLFYRGQSVN